MLPIAMQPSRVIFTGDPNSNRHIWSWKLMENASKRSQKIMENHFHFQCLIRTLYLTSMQTRDVFEDNMVEAKARGL